MIRVTENLRQVHERLQTAARVAGRNASEIRLIAVSKRHPAEAVREAAEAGQLDFGENFVAEGVEKIRAVSMPGLTWHYIGAIQSNKTRDIASAFDWVHTIDRAKVARRLNDQRPDTLPPLEVCLQVNIDDEPQKAGVAPAAAVELAAVVAGLPRLSLRGLMCLPRPAASSEAQRRPFAALRALLDDLRDAHPGLDTLSMGMSNDLEAAVLEGATMVRVGTAIFGARP